MKGKQVTIYNKSMVASFYGVTEKTLKAWFSDEDFMKELGQYRGKAFTPRQLKVIIDHFGAWEQPATNSK